MLKFLKKYKYILTIVISIIIFVICFFRVNELKKNNKEFIVASNDSVNFTEINSDDEIIKNKIRIDIKGQVVNPGVYELEQDSRVIDAIKIAGGLTEIANTSLINLSKKLEDQMVIIIYSNEEVKNSNVKEIETVFKIVEKECNCPVIENDSCINTEIDNDNNTENVIENKININTASLDELMVLPSIGESKAKSIIEYRKENEFITIDDIMNVSGIGEALFEKIKIFIAV